MRTRVALAVVSLVTVGASLLLYRQVNAAGASAQADAPGLVVTQARPVAELADLQPMPLRRTAPPPAVEPDPHPEDEPHPPSFARERMAAQHRLFAQIENAVAARDFALARELLAQHAAEFEGDEAWTDWRDGFFRIVDCLQYPGELSRAAGQHFVEVERGSTLRRRVRRACLGR